MFRFRFTGFGQYALAAAAALMASGLALAQGHGGGGHSGGGGHAGGGHGGGGHAGGGHGGGGHAGGGFAHSGGFSHGGSSHSGTGFSHPGGFGHISPGGHYGGHGYGGYYGHPGYGGFYNHRHSYYPGFYGTSFGLGYHPFLYSGYYYPRRFYDYFPDYAMGSSAYVTPSASYQAYSAQDQAPYYAQQPAAEENVDTSPTDPNAVMIGVRVPGDAQIWFDGNKTTHAGPFREFVSPPLDPDQTYTYEIRAQWTTSSGQVVDQTRKVAVRAGQHVGVDFLAPAPGSPAPGKPKTS